MINMFQKFNLKRVLSKVRSSAVMLINQNFKIRDMRIFQIVDRNHDKFFGFRLNLELVLLQHKKRHIPESLGYVDLCKNFVQTRREVTAAKRSLMTGKKKHVI